MAGPGDDNITGNNYTMNLGIEPDLGEFVQNMTVANDLLDQAEDKFKSMVDIIGTTTQKMHELTRATQLFVSETQRARNEYQRLSTISGPRGLGGEPITQVPTTAPQVTPSTIAQAAIAGQFGGGAGAMMPPGGGGGGGLPPLGGYGGGAPSMGMGARGLNIYGYQQGFRTLKEFGEHQASPNWLQNQILGLNLGYTAKTGGDIAPSDLRQLDKLNVQGVDLTNFRSQLVAAGQADESAIQNMSLSDIATAYSAKGKLGEFLSQAKTAKIPGLGGIASETGEFLPGLTKFGGTAIAGLYAASMANQAINAPLTSAVGYTGMTGGTSATGFGTSGPGAGFGQSALGYKALEHNLSGEYGIGPLKFDFNAALSQQTASEIANTALQHGLSTGGALNMASIRDSQETGAQAIEFMVTQAEKGLTDVGQSWGMLNDIVLNSGGSIDDLNRTLETLRKVSRETGAGMQGLVNAMEQMNESFDAFGGTTGRFIEDLTSAYARVQGEATTAQVRESAFISATPTNMMLAATNLQLTPAEYETRVAMGEQIPGSARAMLTMASRLFGGILSGETPQSKEDLAQIFANKGLRPANIMEMAQTVGLMQPGDEYINVVDRIYQALYSGSSPGAGLVSGYALGGVVSKPTLILAGEQGPEAIVPLNQGVSKQLERAQQKFEETYAKEEASGLGGERFASSRTKDNMGARSSSSGDSSSGFSLPDDFYDKMGQQFLHAIDRGNMKQSTRDESRRRKPSWDS